MKAVLAPPRGKGRRLSRAIVLLAAAIGVSSCAGTTQNQPYPGLASDGSDFALVHFVRSRSFYGSALAAPIEIDGHLVGRLGPGGTLTARIPAREVSISTTAGSIVLDANRGDEYFYEIHLPFHGVIAMDEFQVSAIDRERARELGLE